MRSPVRSCDSTTIFQTLATAKRARSKTPKQRWAPRRSTLSSRSFPLVLLAAARLSRLEPRLPLFTEVSPGQPRLSSASRLTRSLSTATWASQARQTRTRTPRSGLQSPRSRAAARPMVTRQQREASRVPLLLLRDGMGRLSRAAGRGRLAPPASAAETTTTRRLPCCSATHSRPSRSSTRLAGQPRYARRRLLLAPTYEHSNEMLKAIMPESSMLVSHSPRRASWPLSKLYVVALASVVRIPAE